MLSKNMGLNLSDQSTSIWHDKQRNVVVYDNVPDPDRFLALVSNAARLHNGYLAAPATLHNLQTCRWLGLPALLPMEVHGYDWPGRFKPFNAQRVTSNFLVLHPRSFVLSDMGTGKTLSALWSADFLMSCYPGMRCLVVAPLSTLRRVWADTIFEHLLGRRTCRVLHGSRAKRREMFAEPADFYIINPEGLEVLGPEIAARTDLQIVICDEASMFKDRTTRRHAMARRLLMQRPYLWLMTGTPTPNAPTDAYGLAKLVNNAQGQSWASFRNRTMMQLSQFVWRPRQGAHEQVRELLQPSVRFSIDDCMDLPPCTTQRREAELSDAQAKAYRELKRNYVLMTKQGPITAANEAVLRSKLIQISAGAIYGENHAVNHVDCAPRIKVLREAMEECREKIIIFAPFTSVITMLNDELSKDYSTCVIRGMSDGGPSEKERAQRLADFMGRDKPRVAIAHPRTMAHGLTLTVATTVIWYTPIDSTELYLQANKRIDRPGQTHATTIVQLTSTAVETEIYRRLASNETLQGALLALVKGDWL